MRRRRMPADAGIVAGMLVLLAVCIRMKTGLSESVRGEMSGWLQEKAEEVYLPSLSYMRTEESAGVAGWVLEQAIGILPIAGYMREAPPLQSSAEDEETRRTILHRQAYEENEVGADGTLVGSPELPAVPEQAAAPEVSMEKLRDFEYLLSNFYTVDSTTMIGPDQLNVDDLLGRSMKIHPEGGAPKVLIFHTHSQEAFADSVEGDAGTTILGMGELLARQLNELGIPALHHDGIYDLIDGELDRSAAYEYAEEGVRRVLAEYPSIEVVIDLHRDGVGEDTHLVTEVDGKTAAQVMFFNGLSRTKATGDIAYLPNPYIQDNLAFSLQMKLAAEAMYPGFTRRIFLRGYRYSLHMMPKSLLIEAGAQTNTVEEMQNAMVLLAQTLKKVLTE